MTITHFAYPVIQWAFRLFPLFADVNKAAVKVYALVFMCSFILISLVLYTMSGTAG